MSTALAAPPARSAAPARRRDVEGLRALAAGLVVLYHVFLGRVSGGVDVFFVVAGFFVTTMLLDQVARHGRPRLGHYVGRLLSRLLPLALTVLVTVTAAVVLLTPPWWQPVWLGQVTASALYVENWALARASVEYLGAGEPMSPVQHFWALSIQGQFYVLWFALVVVAVTAARRRPARALGLLMGGLFVTSLTYSVWLTARDPALAYFHTGPRVWEFAAGGLLAVVGTRALRLGPRTAAAAAWLGLLLLVTAGLALPPSSFPGWAALWPVGGAVLLLVAGGCGSGRPGSPTRLLGSRPLVWLGGYSYALYLWHWPVLTFAQARAGEAGLDLLGGLLVVAVSLALAVGTTRLVEAPARARLARWPSWRLVTVGLLAATAVAGAAHVVAQRLPSTTIGLAQADPQTHPGAAAARPLARDVPFAPDLVTARTDRAVIYAEGCHQAGNDPELVLCSYGDPAGPTTVMLVGGSHSAHFFPALQVLAGQNGWHLVSATKSSCRFTAGPQPETLQGQSCAAWNDALLQAIVLDRPDLVVTTSTVSGPDGEIVPQGYVERWRALDTEGIPVLAIRDTPRWTSNPLDCLWANRGTAAACSVPRERSLADTDPADPVADTLETLTLVDLTDVLCPQGACPAVLGNVVTYYDGDHLTATMSRSLAPMLAPALAQALADGGQ